MVWFVCGLVAGFIAGVWLYDDMLIAQYKDLHDELVSRLRNEKRKDK